MKVSTVPSPQSTSSSNVSATPGSTISPTKRVEPPSRESLAERFRNVGATLLTVRGAVRVSIDCVGASISRSLTS